MGPGSFPNLSCKREVSMAISVEVSELVENFQWLTEAALMAATEVIKNTYRTLMLCGQKDCFIYCTDKETREYSQQLTSRKLEQEDPAEIEATNEYKGLDLPIVSFDQENPTKIMYSFLIKKSPQAASAFSKV
jgi:hypothetical protein